VRRDEKQNDPETKKESRINLIGTLGMLDNVLKSDRNYSTRYEQCMDRIMMESQFFGIVRGISYDENHSFTSHV
jgi:hypothetical protein